MGPGDCRVSAHAYFGARREPTKLKVGRVAVRRQYERGFAQIEFRRDRLHRFIVEPFGVEHDRGCVTAEPVKGERVNYKVPSIHGKTVPYFE